MPLNPTSLASFVDELSKIAAANGLMHVSKSRGGRRSISVHKLLAKDAKGDLFKKKTAGSEGNPEDVRGDSVDDPAAAKPKKSGGDGPSRGSMIDVGEKTGQVPGANTQTSATTPIDESELRREAVVPKKKGDLPSRGDLNTLDRMDGRGEATTVNGVGTSLYNIGNQPGEYT